MGIMKYNDWLVRSNAVSLTFVNDKIPFVGILCQSSFWSQFLGFVLLCVSFEESTWTTVFFWFSCVDLLKTKFIISLSVLRVDYRFLLLEINIFLFQLEFSSVEPTEAFTTSSDPDSFVGKISNNTTSRT